MKIAIILLLAIYYCAVIGALMDGLFTNRKQFFRALIPFQFVFYGAYEEFKKLDP